MFGWFFLQKPTMTGFMKKGETNQRPGEEEEQGN